MATKKFIIGALLLSLLLSPAGRSLRADDYSSSNFILRDPVIVPESSQTASADFQYYSTTGQTTSGESTSPSFIYRAGFEYYPTASTPVISATTGDSRVSLSWTLATGALANVTSYDVGTATALGGPYSYDNVGNALSYVKNGLTNATPYYFKVKANAGTLTVAESADVSATPMASITPPPTGGGGGGGGGSSVITPPSSVTTVTFSGRAYPESMVTLLVDTQVLRTVTADANGGFAISLTGLSAGSYAFAVYGEDSAGNRSALLSFPTTLTSGAVTTIGSIFIAPTIATDKSEVKKGQKINIFGQSAANSQVTIVVNPGQQIIAQVTADATGAYTYNFATTALKDGQYSVAAKSTLNNETSSFGKSAVFNIGTTTTPPVKKCGPGDLNCDGRVDLADFSIAAYWFKRPLGGEFKAIEARDLNGDGKITLVDFSIIAYYWSG